jgi:AcrR family transcriptional regulator
MDNGSPSRGQGIERGGLVGGVSDVDGTVEAVVLDAARDLLAEGGVKRLTIERVSQRTGVAKTTIYRRWRSRDDLALAVVLEMTKAVVDTPSHHADTRSKLVSLLRSVVTFLADTPMGTVMRGLASEVATDPHLGAAFRDTVVAMRRARLNQVVEVGVARGELRAGIDIDLLHDFLFGPVYYRLLVTGMPLEEALPERIVDAVLPSITATLD